MKTVFMILCALFILICFMAFADKIVELEKRIKMLEVKQGALILQVSGEWEPEDLRYKKIMKKDKMEK